MLKTGRKLSLFVRLISTKRFQIYPKTGKIKNENKELFNFTRRFLHLKIMTNEQLVAAYRDAKKNDHGADWIRLLKMEIRKRGLNP